MKNELKIFFTALMFFTRLPCPGWVDHAEKRLEQSTRYFPFVGWIVGAGVITSFYLSSLFLPFSISIIISMLTGILTTGAFHEDGLADVCDGFGGGWSSHKILDIMKDSRIGTYGIVGLVLVLLSKYLISIELCNISIIYFAGSLWVAHSLSRFAAVNMIASYPYARHDATSKSKPLAKKLKTNDYIVAFFFGLIPLISMAYYYGFILLIILLPVGLLVYFLGRYFNKWIGGFTGDCLGATQQLSEILIYMSMLILWKYIW